jgi:hypothetical protein
MMAGIDKSNVKNEQHNARRDCGGFFSISLA